MLPGPHAPRKLGVADDDPRKSRHHEHPWHLGTFAPQGESCSPGQTVLGETRYQERRASSSRQGRPTLTHGQTGASATMPRHQLVLDDVFGLLHSAGLVPVPLDHGQPTAWSVGHDGEVPNPRPILEFLLDFLFRRWYV